MEHKFRAYVVSVMFELNKGRNLPILNFQLAQLVKSVASETKLDKELVEKSLVSLFSYNANECDATILTLLGSCDLDRVFC